MRTESSTYWSNNVGNVGDGCAASSAQVEDLGARLDVNLLNTAENGSSQFGSERIPYSVLNLFAVFALLMRTKKKRRKIG